VLFVKLTHFDLSKNIRVNFKSHSLVLFTIEGYVIHITIAYIRPKRVVSRLYPTRSMNASETTAKQ